MSISAYLTKKIGLGLAIPAAFVGTIHLSAVAGKHYSEAVFESEERLSRYAANTWRGFKDDVAAAHGYERNPEALDRHELESMVETVALEEGVEVALFKSLVLNESNFNTDALSRAGAIGLGQIMPFHVKTCGYTSSKKLHEPEPNLRCAAKILKRNLRSTNGNREMALCLYNWGRLPTKGQPMPSETRAYVSNVMKSRQKFLRA